MVVDPGFEYSTLALAESYYRAFVRLGYDVVEYDLLRSLKIVGKGLKANEIKSNVYETTEMACASIVNQVILDSIDVVLMIHGYYMNPAILFSLKKVGCKTGLILTDDPMQVDLSRKYSSFYDFVFTNDKNTVDLHKNCYYLPVAVDETIFIPKIGNRDYQLIVGGSFYKERMEFIEKIKQSFLDYKSALVGARKLSFEDPLLNELFLENKISYEKMAEWLANAVICIDIPRDEFAPNSFGYCNQKKIKASCVSPRIFECIATKTLCITGNSRKDYYDFLKGLDCCTDFEDSNDLADKIDHFIGNWELRDKIVDTLYNEVLPHHTYLERAKQIEKIMGLVVSVRNYNIGTLNNRVINKWNNDWRNNFEHCKSLNIYTPQRSINRLEKDVTNSTMNIISNGPSLDETIDSVNSNYPSIFLNDAIKFSDVLLYGKKYAIAIHPNKDVYERCYSDINSKVHNVDLLASTLLYYEVVDKWINEGGAVFFFNSSENGEIKKEVAEYTKYPIFDAGFSVAFSAISAAIYMGAKSINLFGLDFSYIDNKKYASKNSLLKEFKKNELLLTEDDRGLPVLTDSVLIKSRDCVLNLIKAHPDIMFYRHGRGILYGENVPNLRVC
jgi:spore maturation protein CgeB